MKRKATRIVPVVIAGMMTNVGEGMIFFKGVSSSRRGYKTPKIDSIFN
jgi:hypothetical protein